MLTTHQLTFAYNNFNSFTFPDITCRRGEHRLIMGPSGCGKTTLLHLIAGLIRPSGGRVLINEQDITRLSLLQVDKIRGKEIGIVFQRPHFIKSLTVAENLLMAPYLNGLKTDRQQVKEMLQRLNLADKYNSKPTELSQGELQRLSIARAVINNPSVILADEPTSNLDDRNCEEALKLLEEQAEINNASLLIVTHDHRLSAHFQYVTYL